MFLSIRKARPSDIQDITEIYNAAISAGGKTGHLSAVTEEDRHDWLKNRDPSNCPVIVFEENHKVWGYCYLSFYRAGRLAFRHVREISFYVHPDMQGNGLGSIFVKYMISICPMIKVTKLVTYVMASNEASVGLLKKFGFEEWGYFPDVAKHQHGTDSHHILGRHIVPGEITDADQMLRQWSAVREE